MIINNELIFGDEHTDDAVDDKIIECLNPEDPKSFFLYTGAGSGKTRSLEKSLKEFNRRYGHQFRRLGRKIAVITYTNAACDEIGRRVGCDSLFAISTIHSFCWSQIESFHVDIREWLQNKTQGKIDELEEKQKKRTTEQRAREITLQKEKLEQLKTLQYFTYNSNGNNFGKGSLSHNDVLGISAYFIKTKPLMQQLLISRYPFLLIDESQDTDKQFIDAFFELEANYRGQFALGLFGDMMQQIYSSGKSDLGKHIPEHWVKLEKEMNHRSPQRIIQLGNALRRDIDGQRQRSLAGSEKGYVRLFIAPSNSMNKEEIEKKVRERMAEITGDADWAAESEGEALCKILTLEHGMAALRMGFRDLFDVFNKDNNLKDGLKRGDIPELRFFSEQIIPLVEAILQNDQFKVMSCLRKILTKAKDSEDYIKRMEEARGLVKKLSSIDLNSSSYTFRDILKDISVNKLIEIPDVLKESLDIDDGRCCDDNQGENEKPSSPQAWRNFLKVPCHQIKYYDNYIKDRSAFGTHHGVKGLEFDRVLAIISDGEARGKSLFYEKLFVRTDGVEESEYQRVQRLLYVICTRSKKSLALVAYANDAEKIRQNIINKGWFEESEIEDIG